MDIRRRSFGLLLPLTAFCVMLGAACAQERAAARKERCAPAVQASDICVIWMIKEYNECTLNAAQAANDSGTANFSVFQGCDGNFFSGVIACFLLVPPECQGEDRATEADSQGISVSP